MRLIAMGGTAGGHETDFGEAQRLPKLERRAEVTVVDGVEGAAEEANGL